MSKFLKLEIKQKNCTGLYLKVEDDFQKELKSITDVNKYLKDNQTVTLQLRQKVDNKRGKKNFTFFYNETKEDFSKMIVSSFNSIFSIIEASRLDIKEKISKGISLKKNKAENQETKELNDNPTFLEVAEDFLNNRELTLRSGTLYLYKAVFSYSKQLHSKRFKEITNKDIINQINDFKKQNLKDNTIELRGIILKTLFKKNKHLNKLVTLEDIELPTNNTRREYKLSLDDTKRIIQGLREFSKTTLKDGTVFYKKEELKNIFAFSLNGRRISEILNLRFEDINIDTRTFIIKSENAKGKKQLDFYIDDYLLEAIKSQAILRNVDLNSNSNKRVFKTSSVTTPLLNFQKMLQDMNLPKLRLHDIRHLLATTLVQNGTPIQYISRMLGHSKIAITEARYATTNKEQANKAMNDFNKLMEL
ncbi:tyrosine-type recombinase/integrase [Aliarcobacter skirrowii]|uniref:tyrosine-type recombinase/integrase n=1 Tax=Aliarcobacter skirrowii TaxID=28200 RepID=UPI0029AF7C5E|nr:tyrosine-type recombinase/integrase [Aliarcobacter skirrowii]MDX4012990.1 tyrosine-type recombinase/integrase [Aliarcobacter skirrowii]